MGFHSEFLSQVDFENHMLIRIGIMKLVMGFPFKEQTKIGFLLISLHQKLKNVSNFILLAGINPLLFIMLFTPFLISKQNMLLLIFFQQMARQSP